MLSLYSSVGRVQELRTGGHWFNPQQGVQSHRNVHESHRFIKNQVQIYVPKRPRMYEKHLLDSMK